MPLRGCPRASCRGPVARRDRGAGARGLGGGDARAARHPAAPRHHRRPGRLGADLVQPGAGALRRAGGRDVHAAEAAELHRRRDRGVRRVLGVVRGRAVDRRADRGPLRAGAGRRVGAGGLPGAPRRGVRRAARRRDLGDGRRDRDRGRTGRRRTAHRGVLVAGHLRGAGAVRGPGGPGRARRPRRAGGGAGPTSPGAPAQPHARVAVGGAHGGAVPAGPAPRRGVGPLAGDGGPGRVRRTARGPRRPPARPRLPADARGRGRGGLLPHRRRTGRPRAPAVVRARLDRRTPGARGAGARAHRRPAHLAGHGDALPARRARGVDDRCSPHRRGGGAGHPHAGVHRRPPGRAGARAGGHRLVGARRSAAAGQQDRARPGARAGADAAAGSDPRPAPRLRDGGPRRHRAARRGRARAQPRRAAGARRHAGLPRLVPHRRGSGAWPPC